jgi:hypothetical protein
LGSTIRRGTFSLEEAAMKVHQLVRSCGLAGAFLLLALPLPTWAQTKPETGAAPAAERDGQRDFDFEFGSWKAHIRRRLEPLTGSDSWVDLEGTSVVRKVWEGRANLGELAVSNASTRLQGMSLRLYDPESRQWSIYWANSRDGELGEAMVGGFANGRGEFYGQEEFRGRAIYVRFVFSELTATSFRIEQAFSADGGKSWEPNWIASFTRQKD